MKLDLYIRKPKEVQARQIDAQSEIVDCYNGTKIGTQGDFIVCDSHGKVMIIKEHRFTRTYIKQEESE